MLSRSTPDCVFGTCGIGSRCATSSQEGLSSSAMGKAHLPSSPSRPLGSHRVLLVLYQRICNNHSPFNSSSNKGTLRLDTSGITCFPNFEGCNKHNTSTPFTELFLAIYLGDKCFRIGHGCNVISAKSPDSIFQQTIMP